MHARPFYEMVYGKRSILVEPLRHARIVETGLDMEDSAMQSNADLSFAKAGLYLCYMNYHATGEGVRSCISVAGSAQRAEHLIKEKLPNYFHVGLVTVSIDEDADEDAIRMVEWIPLRVRTTLAGIPRGTGEYYSEFHYNLS